MGSFDVGPRRRMMSGNGAALDEAHVAALLDRALELGVELIDTARS